MGQFDMVKDFFLGMSRSRVALVGAMMATVITPLLLGYMLVDTIWHIKNPYFGGGVYLLLGPVFLGGLALIFLNHSDTSGPQLPPKAFSPNVKLQRETVSRLAG